MANLIGYLKDEHKSNARAVSRTSSTKIASTLETWTGAIRTELHRDGTFTVSIGPKDSSGTVVMTGDVSDLMRHAVLVDQGKHSTHNALNGAADVARVDGVGTKDHATTINI